MKIESVRVTTIRVGGPSRGTIEVELHRDAETGGEAVEITLDTDDDRAVFLVGAEELRAAVRP